LNLLIKNLKSRANNAIVKVPTRTKINRYPSPVIPKPIRQVILATTVKPTVYNKNSLLGTLLPKNPIIMANPRKKGT